MTWGDVWEILFIISNCLVVLGWIIGGTEYMIHGDTEFLFRFSIVYIIPVCSIWATSGIGVLLK